MADPQRSTSIERDVEQAIVALKKGAYLLKYGRRGKPKFCPFRLANDESTLIWYSGKDEKQLKLSHVSKIIPGQRTAIFQRYPRPEKEYQSFSLICTDRSLDLICKDKDEAEVWFVGLKALISRRKWRSEKDGISPDGPSTQSRRNTALISPCDSGDTFQKELGETQRIQLPYETPPQSGFARAFSDVILYTAAVKPSHSETVANALSSFSYVPADNSNSRGSAVDTVRVSLSSALSSSSQGSHDDFDALGDVFIWGEGVGDGMLGGGMDKVGTLSAARLDAHLPKALRSTVVLDIHNIGCGVRHAVLVTKQGELFSWGEESGGRLGHGVEADISHPKLVEILSGTNIELLACGEYHTCAVTSFGDIYTWGDGNHNSGLLGHGSEVGYCVPKKISGLMECFHVSSVACGPWHTAVLTSTGQLFTFGDGTFGVLGHGDRNSSRIPREVEALKGLRTVSVACGVWHTAAVVEAMVGSSSSGNFSSGKLFTWGDGDKGRLGHGDQEPRLIPACVLSMVDVSICQVACGNNITVCLSISGRVYTMGSASYGQLGIPEADGKIPSCVKGKIRDSVVEEIACGSYHVAVLTSKTEVYTWGKGAHGRLGHGDNRDRNSPTFVEALKDKQVKRVVCGSNFTAIICLHTWVSSADNSVCFGCRSQFGFRRKRHNCYNCGLVFCKACSSKKSVKAALAPNFNKPYRVCDDCYTNLKKVLESGSTPRLSSGSTPRLSSGSTPRLSSGSVPRLSSGSTPRLSSGSTPRLSSGSTPRFSKNQSRPVRYISKEVAEKETREPRPRGKLSRVSSAESFKLIENKPTICKRTLGLENTRFTPISSGSTQWGSFNLMKSTTLIGPSKKLFSASVPCSTTVSRETSPVSRRSSPSRSRASLEVGTDSKQESSRLRQEVIELRAQVENLTCKSKLLEIELERTSSQLKEVNLKVGKETAKCVAAKEVIKSLTAQLKDMAELVPLGSPSSSTSGSVTGDKSSNPSSMPTSQLSSPTSAENESNGHSQSILSSNGTKLQADTSEWVVQDEPGVFITLSSLSGGGKILRRIRFSRKHFGEKQAEKWWATNRVKVYDRYNIKNDAKSFSGVPISQQETSTSGT